jgi:NhaA family Na+:H+ antiporter
MQRVNIDVLLKPIQTFFRNERITGALLFLSAIVALTWANSPWKESYFLLWENSFTIRFADFEVSKTLHHWINDGLMSIFFFVVGLELKREIIGGELSSFKKAVLPLGAALGGMLMPALIYFAFNHGTAAVKGWGIPMATDIAFALGVLHLLGKRVPVTLKIFLTALAIADDLGAVLTIAFFYTSDISFINLAIGAAFLTTLIIANYLGVRNTQFYAILGIGGLWLAFLLSGVHATVAGVLGAFAIPARSIIDESNFVKTLKKYTARFEAAPANKVSLVTPEQLHIIQAIKLTSEDAETPLQRIEHALHPWVSFVIVPIFALSNAGIELSRDIFSSFSDPVTLGVLFGLVFGKFIGISGVSLLLIRLKLALAPTGFRTKHILGVGVLSGMGFTMSLFITALAFGDNGSLVKAKLGVLFASLISAILGFAILFFSRNVQKQT